MRRTTSACALAVAGAVMAGCGSDEDEALSKPEYVKQANAICKRFNSKVERQAQKAFAGIRDESELTSAKARGFLEAALPEYEQQLEALRELKPPEGDEDTVNRIYDVGAQEGRKIRGSLDDDAALKRLVTSDSVTPRFQGLSKDYGLETCAQD